MSTVAEGGVGTISGTDGDPDSQVLRLGPSVEHFVGAKTVRSEASIGTTSSEASMPEDELRDADESGAEVRPPKAVGRAPVVASPWHTISASVGDAGVVERYPFNLFTISTSMFNFCSILDLSS
jgi:hypothetical protein